MDILELCEEINDQFGECIRILPPCAQEYGEILDKSGSSDTYIRQLRKRLWLMANSGSISELLLKYGGSKGKFEDLKGALAKDNKIYAIRFDKTKPINLRILFTIENDKVYLLLATFQEKNSSDYSSPIELAVRRKKEGLRNGY